MDHLADALWIGTGDLFFSGGVDPINSFDDFVKGCQGLSVGIVRVMYVD
jgi:hypothetical protein